MEEELLKKFKTVFYFFDCCSQFDNQKNCFNDIYELDGIRWDLGKMRDSRMGIIIPYEGEISEQQVRKLREDKNFFFGSFSASKQGDDFSSIYTNLKSFIKFIVAHHNCFNGTNIKYEDVYDYFLDKYYQYNYMSRNMTITDLANAANEYYREHFDSNMDEMDLAINAVLQSIDEYHSNIDLDNEYSYGLYDEDKNDETSTAYCEYRLTPGFLHSYSIKRDYLMKQEGIMDSITKLCNQFSLNSKNSNFVLEVSHQCLARFGGIYDEKDYDEIKANCLIISLDFVDPINKEICDEVQFLLYDLSSHKLIIRDMNFNDKILDTVTFDDKRAIYDFLYNVKEKIDIDLKEKANPKKYVKKMN